MLAWAMNLGFGGSLGGSVQTSASNVNDAGGGGKHHERLAPGKPLKLRDEVLKDNFPDALREHLSRNRQKPASTKRPERIEAPEPARSVRHETPSPKPLVAALAPVSLKAPVPLIQLPIAPAFDLEADDEEALLMLLS